MLVFKLVLGDCPLEFEKGSLQPVFKRLAFRFGV